ncbi:unnamed protein product, partial [Sphacelaria rigidula]
EGAATREEVALKADARYADAALSALRADCALRARQSDLVSLESQVCCLETEHAKTRRASDLAARFVDWFSSRGEAYEHNLGAVEKHIENLATRSVGARARPASPSQGGGLRGIGGGRNDGGSGSGSRSSGAGVPYGGSVRFTPA